MAQSHRIEWLEGLRGLASLQVVLLHYCTAFLPSIGLFDPALAHYDWERRLGAGYGFFLLNGYGAVWLFFVLSGVALTISFSRQPLDVASSIIRRGIRLGIPMVAALLFGTLLLALAPHAASDAAVVTHSTGWLGQLHNQPLTWFAVFHQSIFEGLLTGYSEASVFPLSWLSARGVHVLSVLRSPDAPLWTLSIEFYGSLLVLTLTLLRALLPRWAHRAMSIIVLLLTLPSPFWLFVVGHLLEPIVRRPPRGRAVGLLGLALLIMGVAFCGAAVHWPFTALQSRFPQFSMTGLPVRSTQFAVGATALFIGVCLIARLRSLLQGTALRTLGKLSFSIYLVHFPLLLTLACWVFLALHLHVSYGVAVFSASTIGIAVTFAIAVLFQRLIDGPAIGLSRTISRLPCFRLSQAETPTGPLS